MVDAMMLNICFPVRPNACLLTSKPKKKKPRKGISVPIEELFLKLRIILTALLITEIYKCRKRRGKNVGKDETLNNVSFSK